jgi:hypothetical protein
VRRSARAHRQSAIQQQVASVAAKFHARARKQCAVHCVVKDTQPHRIQRYPDKRILLRAKEARQAARPPQKKQPEQRGHPDARQLLERQRERGHDIDDTRQLTLVG